MALAAACKSGGSPSARELGIFPASPSGGVRRLDSEESLDRTDSGSRLRPREGRRCLDVRTLAVATLLAAVVTLCTSIAAAMLMRDSRVNAVNELVGADGSPIVTKATVVHSYATLTELPGQDHAFLEQMSGVSLWVGEELRFFRIAGFRWSNTSYMVLETQCQREVVVAGGKAFVLERDRDGRRRVIHATTPASEPHCGRRLASSPTAPRRRLSFEDVVKRYHVEISSLDNATREWRRLDEGGLAARGDLYAWFGALVSSEAPAEKLSDLAQAALEKAYCAYDTRGLECAAFESSREPAPPKLDPRGWNRFLLAGSGGAWLLYLDLSDGAMRSKLVEGVLLDTGDATGSSLQVVEGDQSEVWAYQMMHPAVNPRTYNLSSGSGVDDGGLGLAEAVLESAAFEGHKGGCRHFAASGTAAAGVQVERPSRATAAFDCDSGTFAWSIAGWRVLASPDGDIRAFVFGDDTDTGNGTESGIRAQPPGQGADDHVDVRLQYRVLAHAHGSDARNHFRLNRAFAGGTIFARCAEAATRAAGGRRLRFGESVPGVRLPGTNWCGPGQKPERDNFCLSEDFDGDWACRRHDACAKWDFLGPLPVVGCSCDRDLHANRGTGFQADLIHALYGDNGIWPCIAHEGECRRWGWKSSRWGFSYWGVVSMYSCLSWNYVCKYSGQLTEWGYRKAMKSFNLNSSEDWPGCYPNTRDLPSRDWFR